MYPSSTPEDVTFITNQTEACALFIDDSCLNIWKLCLDKCPSVRDVILLNRTEAKDYTTVHSLTLLGSKVSNRNAAWKELAGKIKPQDVSTIIYTSGTTGIPKGVIITHEQIVSELNSAFGLFQIGPGDSSLCFLPLAHVLGRVELWGHIWWGYQLCYAESIEKLRQNLKDIAPTFLIAVPRVFEKIYVTVTAQLESALFGKHIFREALEIGLKISEYRLQRRIIPLSLIVKHQLADRVALSKVREAFGGKLRFAVCGGAPLSEEIARFFHACGVLILEGYGLTETTAAICVNTPFNYRFGSVGCVIGQNQIKIAEDGEILVKGPNVMK
ncbi:MAG: AMP-binding protein, partial [Bdellovibrionaceae bacterium]|nr:AMP-binding protein [Pseudobdellovibrionaceae bacterium]